MNTLRIATWNVLYRDLPARMPLILSHLAAVGADVVLLQEAPPAYAEELAARLAMRVAASASGIHHDIAASVLVGESVKANAVPGPSSDLGGLMVATARVATRIGTVQASSVHLAATPRAWRMGMDPDYRAVAGGAAVDTIGDDKIRTSTQLRLKQLAEIQRFRGDREAAGEVLAGDFNCVPYGPEYRAALDMGLSDAWTEGPRLGAGATILARNPLVADGADAAGAARSLMPGYAAEPDYTLDYQFHSPTLQPNGAWLFGEPRPGEPWASDHLGIAVEYNWAH